MMIVLCILIAALIVLLIALGAYLKAFFMPPWQRSKGYPLPGGEQYAKVKEQTDALARQLRAIPCQQVSITAMDGVRLCGAYYHLADGAPLQIQFHGYHGSRQRDFCGGHKLARDLGHNILAVDQRAHGQSGGHTISFGILECMDCLCWVRYASERFGNAVPILLAGVSMGASTVLMASELDLPQNVRGILADSPYSSPEAIIAKVCRDMRLPAAPLMPFVRLGARIFGGFDLRAASAERAVARSRVPILLLHGEDDRFVPWQMSADIHRANPEKITLATFPGAGHGLSYVSDTPRYTRIVKGFIHACLNPKARAQNPRELQEFPGVFMRLQRSFDGQDVGKAGDFQNLHDGFVHADQLHAALAVHHLLCLQQHAQACGGDVLQALHVQGELGCARDFGIDHSFQLGCGGGVQTAHNFQSGFSAIDFLFNRHIGLLFLPVGCCYILYHTICPVGIGFKNFPVIFFQPAACFFGRMVAA